MVSDSEQYKIYKNFIWPVYKQTEANGGLVPFRGIPPGLNYGIPNTIPNPSTCRYSVVDYSDMFVRADIKWCFQNLRSSSFNSSISQFPSPFLEYSEFPEGYNLAQYQNGSQWYYVNGLRTDNQINDIAMLCCAAEYPGALANVQTSAWTHIRNGGTNGSTGTAGFGDDMNGTVITPQNILSVGQRWWCISSDVYNFDTRIYDANWDIKVIASQPALSGYQIAESLANKMKNAPVWKLYIGDSGMYNGVSAINGVEQLSGIAMGTTGKLPWFASLDGQLQYHRKYRSNPLSAFEEVTNEWGNYHYVTWDYAQTIQWQYSTVTSCSYLVEMSEYEPKDQGGNAKYRLYCNHPVLCNYGDLSVEVWQSKSIIFGDWSTEWRRKLDLELEPVDVSAFSYSGGFPRYPGYYLLRSKREFTRKEMFGGWNSFDASDAWNVCQAYRQQAGLSAWQTIDTPTYVPRNQQSRYTCTAYLGPTRHWVVWKWRHPACLSSDVVLPNQMNPVSPT